MCRTPTGGEARGEQWEDSWPADGAAKGASGRAASARGGRDAAVAPRDLRSTAAAAAEARRVRCVEYMGVKADLQMQPYARLTAA